MRLRRPLLSRRLVSWVQLLALGLLAGITVWSMVRQRHEIQASVVNDFENLLQDRVASWEDRVLDRLDGWLEVAGESPERAGLVQVQFRQREPWFDSLYLWIPARSVTARGRKQQIEAEFLYPRPVPTENTEQMIFRPCLATARIMTMAAAVDVMDVAEAYIEGCRRESLEVRLKAADEAATLLRRASEHQAALRALESGGLEVDTTVRQGVGEGLSPYRVVVHKLLWARVLLDLGQVDEALDIYYTTGLDITGLDAPAADQILQYLEYPILAELRHHQRDDQVSRLDVERSRAERRRRAWREIAERILPTTTAQATEAPRFIYDQYTDTPFLLYYGPVPARRIGAALQLEQPKLLRDFLSSVRRYRGHLVVSDSQGRFVAGTRSTSPIAVQTTFPRTLTHLRVGLSQEILDDRIAQLEGGWWSVLVLCLAMVALGLLAFFAQLRASRNQRELLTRQREFATRVTHELKTPLAGIRVMAENLGAGAWRDEDQRRAMAQRVVDEADRLTLRVEQILSATRERQVPTLVRFDPEEPVLEAVDEWGPRLDQAGVRLHADLHATSEVLGDAGAIRDAVGCLLDNALKYRDEQREDPQVWLTLVQESSWVVVEVTDNGIGVPAKMRRSIFERFVRVEGPNRGRAGGHGLGLAQVEDTARLHRGRVECKEGVEGGARFRLRLPAAT